MFNPSLLKGASLILTVAHMIWSYTHLYVCLSKCCLKKDVQYTRIIISNYVEIHSNFYLCNIIHYPNSAEVTCTHGTSYIRVLWKTLASEGIMRIPRLVPKDGAYEASLQPEGFSAVCLFESSKAGSVLNVLSPPNSRRARPEMLHLIKWQTSPKKQELLPERYSWKDGAIIMFFGCVFALRPRLTPN